MGAGDLSNAVDTVHSASAARYKHVAQRALQEACREHKDQDSTSAPKKESKKLLLRTKQRFANCRRANSEQSALTASSFGGTSRAETFADEHHHRALLSGSETRSQPTTSILAAMPAPSSLPKAPKKAAPNAQVQALEERIKRDDLNAIADLLQLADRAALYALQRTFATLIRQGRLHGKIKNDEAIRKVRDWLKARYSEYTDRLAREGEFTILFDLLRTESERLSSPTANHFAHTLWEKLYRGMTDQALTPEVRTELLMRYLNHFDDLRFYFLRETEARCVRGDINALAVLSLLEAIDMPSYAEGISRFWTSAPAKPAASTKPKRKKRKLEAGSTGIFDSSSDEEGPADEAKTKQARLTSLSAHRKAFAGAWLGLLPLIKSDEALKRVLVILHARIMPHLPRPEALMDWLADCCDAGGTIALLALNGLFTLMTKHNLEYPSFYQQLYAVLDRQVLHVRYRPRFFRMLDVFLSSTHLPVTLVASFAKRLSRLSLAAPPAAAVTVVPFVYNLLKRHPACMVLIHRIDESADEVYQDLFDADEADPLKTNAIDSSLWELATLRNHFLHPAAALARVFEETFTKPGYDLDDFADHSWTTLFEAETARQLRKAPALDLPSARQAKGVDFFPLAPPDEETAWSDAVTELWQF